MKFIVLHFLIFSNTIFNVFCLKSRSGVREGITYLIITFILQTYFQGELYHGMRLEPETYNIGFINGLGLFIAFGILVPVGLSLSVRRLHDFNLKGWWLLLGLLPYVGIVLVILLLLLPGMKTDNNFGPPKTYDYLSLKWRI